MAVPSNQVNIRNIYHYTQCVHVTTYLPRGRSVHVTALICVHVNSDLYTAN